jgi:hypothetical protein
MSETESKIPTIDPEIEPEYVGAHSALHNERCQNWCGETVDDVEQCGDDATHTVVMYNGSLHEIAMCDDCGEPQDVDSHERKWTGEVTA